MINDFTHSFALEYAAARTKFRATASADAVHWRESTAGQAISITQRAVEGLASWSLAAAA